jgi:hypothetical protein
MMSAAAGADTPSAGASKLQWETVKTVCECEFQVLNAQGGTRPWNWRVICAKSGRLVLHQMCPHETRKECTDDMEYCWEKLQRQLEEDSHRRKLRDLELFLLIDEAAFCDSSLFEKLFLPLDMQKDVAALIVTPPGLPDNWIVCEGNRLPDAVPSTSIAADRTGTDPELPARK